MCCFFAALLFLGPRIGILIGWLIPWFRVQMNQAFRGLNYPWMVMILGIVFLPWATLMYILIYPLTGFDWVWIALGAAADIFSWVGGDRNRHKVPGYTSTVGTMDPPPPTEAPPAAPPPAPPPAAPTTP
jgi:hypothetical protein